MKNRELLEHPFEPNQIRQRKGTFGGMLDYVEGHAIIQRLNDALDGDWSFEITTQDILEKSDEVVVIGKLQAGGVTKMQFGSSAITRNKTTGDMVSLADDFKAAATDSLNKCATLLGVGLHLYQSKRPDHPSIHRGDNVTPLYPEAGGASYPRQPLPKQVSNQRLTDRQFNYILRLSLDRGVPRQELDQYSISEVFSLKWSDVDFDTDRVRLWTRKREGGHHEFDWVPMTQDLRSQLRSWWQERIGMKTEDHDHVFVCLTESPFCDEYFGKPFKHRQYFIKRMCERAGVKAFGFHAIRHLTASILYRKGQPLSVIQSILCHKNPNTTTRYLRSLGLEETREALEEGLTQPAKIIPLKRQSVSAGWMLRSSGRAQEGFVSTTKKPPEEFTLQAAIAKGIM